MSLCQNDPLLFTGPGGKQISLALPLPGLGRRGVRLLTERFAQQITSAYLVNQPLHLYAV